MTKDKNARHKHAIGSFFNTDAGRQALVFLMDRVDNPTTDLAHETLAFREGERAMVRLLRHYAIAYKKAAEIYGAADE